jgi:uncharacterized protein (TIGR03437 family)
VHALKHEAPWLIIEGEYPLGAENVRPLHRDKVPHPFLESLMTEGSHGLEGVALDVIVMVVVILTKELRLQFQNTVEIEGASPGLFTANATGQGVASAQVVRVTADGSLQYAEVASFDPARRQMVGRPVELGKPGETVYLVLYGTGIRYRRSLEDVKLVVGGLTLPVLYAGPQPQFIGVDQVNLLLPKELAARGEVDMQLFVEGKASNRVVIHLR